MGVARPTTTEMSLVVYLHVLDVLSESKDTLLRILLDLGVPKSMMFFNHLNMNVEKT